MFIVGNKCDLVKNRQVEYTISSKFCEKKNIDYYETSVITNEGIKRLKK